MHVEHKIFLSRSNLNPLFSPIRQPVGNSFVIDQRQISRKAMWPWGKKNSIIIGLTRLLIRQIDWKDVQHFDCKFEHIFDGMSIIFPPRSITDLSNLVLLKYLYGKQLVTSPCLAVATNFWFEE